MIDKKIYRYTNVELLDTIRNSKNNELAKKAEVELQSRKLGEEEMKKSEVDYKQYKVFQELRKEMPLTAEEWLTFLFLSLSKGRDHHFSESEMERFKKHGFEKKFYQARKIKKYGYIFWFVMIMLLALITSLI
ncbi:hypothetical protein EYD45_08680 [Hyunsoonleella flava]|uniref:Uncharacterized protein n=1 Tax=Hyunsoonleella flava TaxID=2527939 RepID=A0A4Q9FCS4_9FLAO|nr:hypothetical protein [Hyunsoonleella flava]TBN03583.1 hypothetical protein EYD45_08680 [Hyunsoonleella flava]